ncbi:MAG: hypothetical protein ACK5PG_18390 [Lysobacterales bacterium]|jgi:hypothetical protein
MSRVEGDPDVAIDAALQRLAVARARLAQALQCADATEAPGGRGASARAVPAPMAALVVDALDADVLHQPARALLQVAAMELSARLRPHLREHPLLWCGAAAMLGAATAGVCLSTRSRAAAFGLVRMAPLLIGLLRPLALAEKESRGRGP